MEWIESPDVFVGGSGVEGLGVVGVGRFPARRYGRPQETWRVLVPC